MKYLWVKKDRFLKFLGTENNVRPRRGGWTEATGTVRGLGFSKYGVVLGDLLGQRPTVGYCDDTKSLVLKRLSQCAILR